MNQFSHTERAWTRLPSGRRLDLTNPDPDAWTNEDLAIRLARTSRWSGESRWPVPLSVAQHSLLVLEIARLRSTTALAPARALCELLHDAEEGFLGFDCISPLKKALGEGFTWTSQRLLAAVWKRYALPKWSPAEREAHKTADRIAAASEAVHVVGWTEDEVRTVLGIDSEILQVDPLTRLVTAMPGLGPWEPWPAQLAAQTFLDQLETLLLADC